MAPPLPEPGAGGVQMCPKKQWGENFFFFPPAENRAGKRTFENFFFLPWEAEIVARCTVLIKKQKFSTFCGGNRPVFIQKKQNYSNAPKNFSILLFDKSHAFRSKNQKFSILRWSHKSATPANVSAKNQKFFFLGGGNR